MPMIVNNAEACLQGIHWATPYSPVTTLCAHGQHSGQQSNDIPPATFTGLSAPNDRNTGLHNYSQLPDPFLWDQAVHSPPAFVLQQAPGTSHSENLHPVSQQPGEALLWDHFHQGDTQAGLPGLVRPISCKGSAFCHCVSNSSRLSLWHHIQDPFFLDIHNPFPPAEEWDPVGNQGGSFFPTEESAMTSHAGDFPYLDFDTSMLQPHNSYYGALP